MASTVRLWTRAFVTVAAALAAWGAAQISLPGVDADLVRQLMRGAGRASPGSFEQLSVVALGLAPALSGFVIVELVALAVPRWRPLRTGGPRARASLRAPAVAVSIGLAAIQGWLLAVWLESFSYRYGMLVRQPGLSSRLLIAVTLVGGTCLLLLAARWIDRRGLGSGFAVLLGASLVPYLYDFAARTWLRLDGGDLDLADVLGFLVRVGALGAATWWILTFHKRSPGALRHPTSGALPVAIAASLLMLPVTLANLGLAVGGVLPAPGTTAYRYASAVLIALSCGGLSWLFYRGARGTRAWWEAVARSTGLLVAGFVLTSWGRFTFEPAVAIAAVAIALDLADEWRARAKLGELVAVWPVHQVARLDEYSARLANAGIPALARGAYYRALLQFFGPYVPIDLMVPAERADEARQLLER